MSDPILFNSKTKDYAFLSNFHSCPIRHNGVVWKATLLPQHDPGVLHYTSVEAAYQAAKCRNPEDRVRFTALAPWDAKELGSKIEIRDDWTEAMRLEVMWDLLGQKFVMLRFLADRLRHTRGRRLVHQAPWDPFWGDGKDGLGHDHLGRMLMRLRDLGPAAGPI